jgi:hypothetical protein
LHKIRFILKVIFILIFGFINYQSLFSGSPGISADDSVLIRFKVALSVGYPVGATSTGFFEGYQKILSGKATEFRMSPSLSISLTLPLNEKSGLRFIGEYSLANFSEEYSQSVTTGHTGTRYISQNFTVNNLPFVIAYEFSPVASSYKTYIGAGLGASFGSIIWKESVYSSIEDDIRIGGEHFNKLLISPVARIYSGVELSFDKNPGNSFLQTLLLESTFNFFLRNADIFNAISKQFYKQPEDIGKSFTILPFYIGLNIGMTFNLNFDKVKKSSKLNKVLR